MIKLQTSIIAVLLGITPPLVQAQSHAIAPGQQALSSQQQVNPSFQQPALPPGYSTLLLDYEGVAMRMTIEQRADQGKYWPAWMRPGLQEGNSLYWWLLARWHHNEGNRDLAYRTLLTAWVLTRMETVSCMGTDDPLLENLLIQHRDILGNGSSSNKSKQEAVLYSLNIGKQMITRQPLRGMACNIIPAREALDRHRLAKERWEQAAREAAANGQPAPPWQPNENPSLIDYRTSNDFIQRDNYLRQQNYALEEVGEEFRAKQAWDSADINTVLKTLKKAQKQTP